MQKYFSGILLCVLIVISTNSDAANRFALVIGNSNYKFVSDLNNASNDAREISKSLRQLNFLVTEKHNLKHSEMKSELVDFANKLQAGSTLVFYYAGHGVRRNAKSYILPIDAHIRDGKDISLHAFDFELFLDKLGDTSPKITIALLDSCNNNPFNTKFYEKRGLLISDLYTSESPFRYLERGIVAYSTEPGNVAIDGYTKHAPFTSSLLGMLKIPGLSITDLLDRVTQDVFNVTAGRQSPWYYYTSLPKFCFAGCKTSNKYDEDLKYVSIATERTLLYVKNALQKKNLVDLKKVCLLNDIQEKILREIFNSHSSLQFAKLTPLYLPNMIYPHKVDVRIIEAVNLTGNRVFPASTWSDFSIKLRTPYNDFE